MSKLLFLELLDLNFNFTDEYVNQLTDFMIKLLIGRRRWGRLGQRSKLKVHYPQILATITQ